VNYWKVILATMVIFGTGVLTGGLLVHKTAGPKKARPARVTTITNTPPPNVTPSQIQRLEFLVRANRELDLTTEQRERVERILKEGQERTREIWEGVAPEMRKELQLVRERIKAELTPEQRRKFEEIMKRPLRPAARPEDAPPRDRSRQGNPETSAPVEQR
jgi:hypothetical protein